jgi:uncharacterized iron-regulated protein
MIVSRFWHHNEDIGRCRSARHAAWRAACALGLAWLLAGCAASAAGPHAPAGAIPALPPEAVAADVLLIGELHDNAVQHRLRLGWLESLADARPMVLALEQFDSERQADLDRALAADLGESTDDAAARARRVAEAAGFDFRSWDWVHYGPVVELALRRRLPLVAANLSRRETSAVARGEAGAVAAPEPSGWSAHDRNALEEAIRSGHCGLLPEARIAPMAAAQRARDARMADSVAEARRRTGLPVVLLAGNVHVRNDIGVPRYLADRLPHDRLFSIGLLEEGGASMSSGFHRVEYTAPQSRVDPCESLKRPRRPAPQ